MDDDCDDGMEIYNHDQVDGQEIPTDGCSAQLSSHQILLSGGRACPTCAFVYDSNTGVFLKIFWRKYIFHHLQPPGHEWKTCQWGDRAMVVPAFPVKNQGSLSQHQDHIQLHKNSYNYYNHLLLPQPRGSAAGPSSWGLGWRGSRLCWGFFLLFTIGLFEHCLLLRS